ncbi:MAG: hypothetical protein ABIQ33_04690 [Caldimonas sp.]
MTPKNSPLTALMHAVLDGEASDVEARELEVHLSADPALRAEFEDWKRLFQALGEVPKEHAPEGLVASVLAAVPAVSVRVAAQARQPFRRRRVIGRTLSGFFRPGLEDFRATEPPGFASAPPTRSVTMSEQNSRRIFTHRKAWLGAGIAAAAAVAVAQFSFDFPIAKDVTGTVLPAERYRAAPNGSEDVKLGAPGAAAKVIGSSVAAETGRSVAERTADLAAQRTETQKTADLAAQRSEMQKTSNLAAQRSESQKTADLTAQRSETQMAADRVKADRMAERSTAEMTVQRNEAARLEMQRSMEKSTNRSAQP